MLKARQIALATALVVAVAGCSEIFDRRSDSNQRSDSGRGEYGDDDVAITASVERQLARDQAGDLRRVAVKTVDGTVYLTGVVPDAAAKQQAADLARRVSGVRRLVDRMEIAAQRSRDDRRSGDARRSGDEQRDERKIAADITAGVKKGLSDGRVGGRIGVLTRDGVVTLTGTVADSDDKVRAGRVAKAVAGVQRVENNLRISTGDTSGR